MRQRDREGRLALAEAEPFANPYGLRFQMSKLFEQSQIVHHPQLVEPTTLRHAVMLEISIARAQRVCFGGDRQLEDRLSFGSPGT